METEATSFRSSFTWTPYRSVWKRVPVWAFQTGFSFMRVLTITSLIESPHSGRHKSRPTSIRSVRRGKTLSELLQSPAEQSGLFSMLSFCFLLICNRCPECGSRLPRQDSTTTATPIARVTALKITDLSLFPAYTLYSTRVFRLHIGTICMRMCPFYRCLVCFFARMYMIAANTQAQRIVSTPVSLIKYILLSPAVMT